MFNFFEVFESSLIEVGRSFGLMEVFDFDSNTSEENSFEVEYWLRVGNGNDFEDVATVAFLFIGEKYLNAIGSKDWVEWVDLNSFVGKIIVVWVGLNVIAGEIFVDWVAVSLSIGGSFLVWVGENSFVGECFVDWVEVNLSFSVWEGENVIVGEIFVLCVGVNSFVGEN